MLPEFDPRSQKDAAQYRETTTRSRFMQQIFLGLGGATVFGVVGALTHSLLGPAQIAIAHSAFFSAPVLGLAAIALAGVACLYIGATMLSNTIMMEQDYAAKKIAIATNGRAPEIAQTPTLELEHTKQAHVSPIAVSLAEQQKSTIPAAPESIIQHVSAHERLAEAPSRTQQA